jgi:hypothetical protein
MRFSSAKKTTSCAELRGGDKDGTARVSFVGGAYGRAAMKQRVFPSVAILSRAHVSLIRTSLSLFRRQRDSTAPEKRETIARERDSGGLFGISRFHVFTFLRFHVFTFFRFNRDCLRVRFFFFLRFFAESPASLHRRPITSSRVCGCGPVAQCAVRGENAKFSCFSYEARATVGLWARWTAATPSERRLRRARAHAHAHTWRAYAPMMSAYNDDMSPPPPSNGEIARCLVEPPVVAPDGSNRAHIIDLLRQSRGRWLKNTEVCDILLNHRQYAFELSTTAPITPPGAHFLFSLARCAPQIRACRTIFVKESRGRASSLACFLSTARKRGAKAAQG